MAMPGELDHDHCLEESCGKPLDLQVCMSGGGYYLGTQCDMHGPNSRESEYFPSEEEAEAALAQWKEGNKVGKRDADYHPADITMIEIPPGLGVTALMDILRGSENTNVTVNTGPCVHCGKSGTITLPRAAYERITAGEHMQRAWPQGTAGEREQLINGTHPACFDEMFPPDEEY